MTLIIVAMLPFQPNDEDPINEAMLIEYVYIDKAIYSVHASYPA
jgi:hypothetical protein